MAYFLAIKERKGKDNPFYKKVRYNKNDRGYSLEDIDLITTRFYDERAFKDHLFVKGYIDSRDAFRPLVIASYDGGHFVPTRYEFLYQKDANYICDPESLVNAINDRLWLNSDFDFIETLASKYSKVRGYEAIAGLTLEAAKESKKDQAPSEMFNLMDSNGDDLLTRFVKSIIYESYTDDEEKITYLKDGKNQKRNVLNYARLRALIVFMNNKTSKNKNSEVKGQTGKSRRKENPSFSGNKRAGC